MVKYLIVRDVRSPGEPPVGALYWDGTTLRSWGILNRPPTLDREPPGSAYAKRILTGSMPLSLLLTENSQSDRAWRIRNHRVEDTEAATVLAELDGYEYPSTLEETAR